MGRRNPTVSVKVEIDLSEIPDEDIIHYFQTWSKERRIKMLVANQADLMKLEHFMSVIQDFSLSEIEERLKK